MTSGVPLIQLEAASELIIKTIHSINLIKYFLIFEIALTESQSKGQIVFKCRK
jgi:hypothetical protein